MIHALVSRLETPLPRIQSRYCLRVRLPDSPASDRSRGKATARCTRCLDACPMGALSVLDGVQVDPDRCNSCGLCTSHCPTGAISDPSQEINRLDPFSGVSLLSIGCRLGSADGMSWTLAVEAVCGLSWQFVAAAALRSGGDLRLDCRHCEGCRYGPGMTHVESICETARCFLAATGIDRAITVVSRDSQEPCDGGVTRREFFRTLAGRANGSLREAAGKYGLARIQARTVNDLLWQAAIHAATADVNANSPGLSGQPPFGELWHSFRVGPECDGCGLCAHLCPAGAWSSSVSGDTRTLFFTRRLCVGCGTCAAACPSQAIKRDSAASLPVRDDTVAKAAIRGVPCRRCGRLVRYPEHRDNHEGSRTLCSNCAKQASLVMTTEK